MIRLDLVLRTVGRDRGKEGGRRQGGKRDGGRELERKEVRGGGGSKERW